MKSANELIAERELYLKKKLEKEIEQKKSEYADSLDRYKNLIIEIYESQRKFEEQLEKELIANKEYTFFVDWHFLCADNDKYYYVLSKPAEWSTTKNPRGFIEDYNVKLLLDDFIEDLLNLGYNVTKEDAYREKRSESGRTLYTRMRRKKVTITL